MNKSDQQPQDTLYCVCFKSRLTDAVGRGLPIAKDLADEWVSAMNHKYHGIIDHWIEIAEPNQPEKQT